MEQIIRYIQKKYHPLSVILYGSYANGTNNAGSDFDALVIFSGQDLLHDTSFVGDTQLDVFVYPASFFEGDYPCEDFIQIFDGRIITDYNDIGKSLQTKVQALLQTHAIKTEAELQASIDWCSKMLTRAKRQDCEGLFRWHWLLIDSLEIFCNLTRHPYLGPKKTLKWMEETHPEAFDCYRRALSNFHMEDLEAWIACLKSTKGTN